MKKILLAGVFTIITSITTSAQTEEGTSINLTVENDLFLFKGDGTDRYYTNGIRLEYFYQKEKRRFLSSLLLQISDDKNIYSWGLSQNMFTPSRIDIKDIQYDDRPYAGTLFAIHSLSSYDYSKKIKIASELNMGVIGPLSLADETQIWIHRLINDEKPEGWKNQIPNDIILNYNLRIEKEMMEIPDKLTVSGTVESYVGTMYDAMGAGFVLKLGKVKSIFEPWGKMVPDKRKYQLYVLFKPTVRVIYFNALLQGGIIHHLSQSEGGYTLDKDKIERLSAFTEVGLVYDRPKMNVKLLQKMRTAAFKEGTAMEFGHISFSFKL